MSEQGASMAHWWASGDMPVGDVPRLAFLIDGRMTMLEMCLAFLCARQSIYITAWGLSPEILLVRGKHKCAGADGAPEQEELLAWLRAKGLAEEELRNRQGKTSRPSKQVNRWWVMCFHTYLITALKTTASR